MPDTATAPNTAPGLFGSGLFDRALRRITSAWRDMASAVVGEADESIEAQMRACLAGRGGEVSARNRAAKLAEAYLELDEAGRLGFLRTLAGFELDAAAVEQGFAAWMAAADSAARPRVAAALRASLEAPRRRLLTQFASIPDGIKFLVDLRAFVLGPARADPALAALEADLKSLLANWFDLGFLELRRIDWDSPAALLEKLVGYEAVHEIRGWRDLKNRLDSDRRCYAFFHPRMPGEPLIFVEVALVQGLADSVQRLLDQKAPVLDPRVADTAIFYSISNCQRGLDGISFGSFLIKRVVDVLSAEFRNLKQFATLSPIPGFRAWLADRPAEPALLSAEEDVALRAIAPVDSGGDDSGRAALATLLARRSLPRDMEAHRPLAAVLERLCARYLLEAGRGGRAADPVAHFHLTNGARIERINPLADISEKGLRESAGMMVNYLYDPARIERQHEEYVGEGRRGASAAVRKLLRG